MGVGGGWGVGGSYLCPRHLLHFSPRIEETQTGKEGTERKGRLKKEQCFRGFHCQRSHT